MGMTTCHFSVPGAPVPKGRPRFSRRGRVYTPKRTKDYEEHVAWCAVAARARIIEGPVSLELDVVFKRAGQADLDNVAKAVADALHGVCYANDRQIKRLLAQELLPDKTNPRVDVRVEEIAWN